MLSEQESRRLEELTQKRTQQKLDSKEYAEFKKLKSKVKSGSKESSKGAKFVAGNDISWWIKAAELVKDSANFTPNWIPGQPLDSQFFDYYPIGVIRVDFQPTYGSDWNVTDPVNMEIKDLFLRMFQKYRGITLYQHSDLGMVLISEFEIIGLISKLERIYGVVNRYSKANFNMPTTEVAALGLTAAQAEYIRHHLSDYRYDLNLLLKKAQRLLVPKDYSIIANKLSLLGYEYVDHDKSSKAQIIIFDTNTFGQFNETDLTTGSCVKFTAYETADIINFSDPSVTMFPLLSNLLESLLGSDSVNKILGDLLTWFGEEQMLQILPIPEDYVIVPTFSESILHKMHNMHTTNNVLFRSAIHPQLNADDKATLTSAIDNDVYYIYQAGTEKLTSVIVSKLTGILTNVDDYSYVSTSDGSFIKNTLCEAPELLKGGASVLDTYRAGMDTETVVEGVLWKFSHDSVFEVVEDTNVITVKFDSFAFESIKSINCYRLNRDGTVTAVNTYEQFKLTEAYANQAAGVMCNIDWAPLTYAVKQVGSDRHYEPFYLTGEYENMRVLTGSEIKRLQTSIVISGFTTDVKVIQSSK